MSYHPVFALLPAFFLTLSPSLAAGDNQLRTAVGVAWLNDIFSPAGGSSQEMTAVVGPLTDTITDGFTTNGEDVSGSASASANYGTLGVNAQIMATNSDNVTNLATGGALFTDTFTFNGGTAGDAGTVNFTFDITGSSTVTGAGQVTAGVFVLQDQEFTLENLLGSTPTIEVNGDDFGVNVPLSVVFGTPTEITVALGVVASAPLLNLFGELTTGMAEGAYGKTLQLVDITSPDASLLGIETTSGTNYLDDLNGPVSVVPEPRSSGLALLGLLSLGLLGRRPRRGLFRTRATLSPLVR